MKASSSKSEKIDSLFAFLFKINKYWLTESRNSRKIRFRHKKKQKEGKKLPKNCKMSDFSMSSSPIPVGWSASFDKTYETLTKSWPHIALKVGEYPNLSEGRSLFHNRVKSAAFFLTLALLKGALRSFFLGMKLF